MTIVSDMANDYLQWVGTEAVTLVSLPGKTGETSVAVGNALKRAVSQKERVALNLGTDINTVAWNLPNAQVVAGVSKVRNGDKIKSDGDTVVWTVQSVDLLRKGTRWRAVCTEDV